MTVQRDAPVPRIAPIIQGEDMDRAVDCDQPPSQTSICWHCGQGYAMQPDKGAQCRECESVRNDYDARVEMVHQAMHRELDSDCKFSWVDGVMLLGGSCDEYLLAMGLVPFPFDPVKKDAPLRRK